jgi:hypothetical protein
LTQKRMKMSRAEKQQNGEPHNNIPALGVQSDEN